MMKPTGLSRIVTIRALATPYNFINLKFVFCLMWLSARLSTVHSTGVCLACYKNRDIRTHSETVGCPLFAAAITLTMPRFDLKPSPEMVLYFLAGFAKQNSEDRSPIPLVIRDSTALFTGAPMSVHSLANALAPFKALTGTSGFRGALRLIELVAEIRLLPTCDAEIQIENFRLMR
eukprot:740353_1